MNDTALLLRELARRGLIALPIFVVAWILLAKADGGLQGSFVLFFGMALMVLSAIIVGPTLARIVVQPAGSLFYPTARFDGPQPVYSIPTGLRVRGQFEEALEGFRSISREHPQLVRPYAEMMDIAIQDLGNPGLADEIYEEARHTLHRKSDRDRLDRMRSFLLS